MAVERNVFETFFKQEVGQFLLEEPGFCLFVFDAKMEEIIEWKPQVNF
ncbi:MAG: hypothetical protein F6K17_40330 [Okeania sp. SIO3C4]|nr:hypothetical protein [Okeania sp. SIO3C4]